MLMDEGQVHLGNGVKVLAFPSHEPLVDYSSCPSNPLNIR